MRGVGLGHRHDDEVGDPGRGTRSGSPRRPRSAERRRSTSSRRPASTGGSAAPLPSSTTRSGPRPIATRHALEHVRDRDARPPARRRSGGSRPSARRRRSPSRDGPRRRGGRRARARAARRPSARRRRPRARAGRPAPSRPRRSRRVAARRCATWPVTAVFPTRLPVPITARVGHARPARRRRVEAEVRALRTGRRVRARGSRARTARAARAPARRRGRGRPPGDGARSAASTRRLERDAVVVAVPAQLLGAADEHRRDDEVVDLLERSADDGRVVLAVDDRDHASHPRVVTSRSIRPVYFSYSNVSVENWMIRSSPWNGCRREIETWLPLTSTTL